MLRRPAEEPAEPADQSSLLRGGALDLVRRVRHAARRTIIRLRLSKSDLAPIGEDIDRLLERADDLSLSPESQNMLLALDDEISQDLAGDDPHEDGQDSNGTGVESPQ